MNCPLCSAQAAEGAAECPSCGVLFAKLKEREERAKQEAQAALALAETAARAPSFNPWKVRAVAGAVVLAWLIGFGLYIRSWLGRERRPPKRRAYENGSTLLLRDLETGKLKPVPVFTSPSSSSSQPPPPPRPVDAKSPVGGPAYDPDFDD